MKGLKYTLILEEPVLANSLTGDTNSARSLPFVPGGLVRGALISAYANGRELDAGDDEFRRLFLNGKTRFLPAYPELNERRSLPAPFAWKVKKHTAGKMDPVFNFAVKIKEEEVDLKTAGFDLWQLVDGNVHSLDQEWNINVHTQRDALYGRAMGVMEGEEEARGAVFRYEALPAGLRLHGLVFTANDTDAQTLIELLEGRSLMLGKARTAGYGHARVESVAPIGDDWRRGYWPWEIPPGEVKSFTLTFLSPAILRGASGQYTLDPVDALKARGIEATAEKIFRSAEIVGGFNRTWGMPLPQCWAIAAGSVFVFKSNTNGKALQDLEEQGLGERLAEGFGCVAVDISQPQQVKWCKVTTEYMGMDQASGMSTVSQKVGGLMLQRLLRRDLDARVLEFVSRATHGYEGGLAGSQLSRWRVILRSVQGTNDPAKMTRLTDLFEKETKRASASWKKMERVRVHADGKPKRLTEWLEDALKKEVEPWQMLGYEEGNVPSRSAGTLVYHADQKLKFEYRLRVIDALFAALVKKKPKPKTKKEVQHG